MTPRTGNLQTCSTSNECVAVMEDNTSETYWQLLYLLPRSDAVSRGDVT